MKRSKMQQKVKQDYGVPKLFLFLYIDAGMPFHTIFSLILLCGRDSAGLTCVTVSGSAEGKNRR